MSVKTDFGFTAVCVIVVNQAVYSTSKREGEGEKDDE
jgi:hypothetical protein